MTEELETMKVNLNKTQGLVKDVQIAAEKLPPSQAADYLDDAIESALGELTWALHYLGEVAKEPHL